MDNPSSAEAVATQQLPASPLPDTIYLRNERGELVPVLGWKYEDFAALYGRRTGEPVRPEFETTRCELVLTERPETIEGKLTVGLRLARSGWTAIPLQLDQLKLQGAPEIDGSPRHWIRRDRQSGWWLWIEGRADQEVTVRMSGLLTPARLGDQRRLEVTLPSSTDCRVELTPLEPNMVVDFGGQRGQVIDAARYEARGLAGNTLIRWQPAGGPIEPAGGIWEAALNLDLRVDGPRTVSALGDLELTAYGQPLREFRLMLPPGTQLLPQNPLDPTVHYDVSEESQTETATVMKFQMRSPQLKLRVRFQAVTTGPEAAGEAVADTWLRCADYAVVGALRQTGRVRLFASDDWVVQWLDTAAARTTDPGSAATAAAAGDELLAAVAIYQQPCGLGLKIRPRESRVDVEPEYWLKFQRGDVELTGRLTYHIRGAKATRLQIDCTGWEDIRVSSSGTGPLGPTVVDDGQPITIQLPSAVRGDLEVLLTAHRRLPTETGRMSIPLPRPTGSVLPTKVVLATTGNRTVTPVLDEMPSAAPETVSMQLAAELVAEMAGMRTVGLRLPRDAAVDQLVLDVATHEREIDVQQVNRIRVGTRSIQVRQIFSYSVAYEPLSTVTLVFPANLNPATEISWAVNGVRVTPEPPAAGRSEIQVPVTAAGTGSFEVVASYTVPFPSLSSGPLPLSIPLISPQGAEITTQEAHWFRDAGAVRLEPYAAGDWQTDEDLRRRIGCELALTSAQPRDQCTVLLRPGLPGETPRTSIHGGWLQTWLSDGVRFDRAVYDIETRERSLTCRMPRGFTADQCVVTVNGTPQTVDMSPAGVLSVRLPELREDRALVEIAYRVPYRPEGWRASIDLPQIHQANWIGRWIWQVVVGPHEHVYATSINLTPLDRWTWHGWYWARSATWQQADLESWLKASRQPPIPAASNQYTFTSLRPAETAQLWLLEQRWVLIVGAGLAVLLLLAWTQYLALRHWGLTVPLAFALLSLGIWAPTPALMLGQAAVVGVLAFLVAQLWVRIVSSRRQPAAIGSHSTRTIIKPASHMRPPSSVASATSGSGDR